VFFHTSLTNSYTFLWTHSYASLAWSYF